MKEKRKVLFVHDGPLYCDDKGNYLGVHYSDKIKKRYLNLGSHVTFLMRLKCIDRSSASSGFQAITNKNFSFVEIPDFKSIIRYFTHKRKAEKIIRQTVQDHDILVARMPSASGTMAIRAARDFGLPYLVEFVACTYDAYWNYGWKGKLIAHYKMWEQQRLMKEVPYTIYVTKYFLQNRYPTKGKSINCSNVELNDINETDLNNRISKIENLQGNFPVLGTVAAVNVPYKGQDDVIRALGSLKKQGIDYRYKLVGQGDQSRLKRIISENKVEDRVELLGSKEHSTVFKFMENIDVYIQPSKQEGLPRALIEAMSKACPALGARTAGIPELLDPECIFKPGDVNEIAEKLQNINRDWLVEQSKRNFEVSKGYEKAELEKRRLHFYHEFLNDHGLESRI